VSFSVLKYLCKVNKKRTILSEFVYFSRKYYRISSRFLEWTEISKTELKNYEEKRELSLEGALKELFLVEIEILNKKDL